MEKEIKRAFAITFVFIALFAVQLNYVLSFTTVSLEIRKGDKAAYVVQNSLETKFKASNDPEDCDLKKKNLKYINNLKLAFYLKNSRLKKIPESLHDQNSATEYVVKIVSRGQKKEYYYSADRPRELQSIINILTKPWSKNIEVLGF